MIATATFIAALTWEEDRREEEHTPGDIIDTIFFLLVFGWFDLEMASIIAGGL